MLIGMMMRYAVGSVLFLTCFWSTVARAVEVNVSAKALERTLRAQLFTVPYGPGETDRYFLRGNATSACFVSVDSPQVSFKDDRVVVHVHTHAKLGTSMRGNCLGLSLNTEADVSFVPQAEGESIGFRDARVERLSDSKELNFLLVPFLSHKMPAQMKINAAVLMRTLLIHSAETTGYDLSLTSLKLHSMLVQGDALVVDVDATMRVD